MAAENQSMNEVHEELRKTHEQLKEYVDRKLQEERNATGNEASAETREKVEELNNTVQEVQERYNELVRNMNRPESMGGGAPASAEDEKRWSAFSKYLRYGVGEEGRSQFTDEEYRALSSASDSDGGFLVPTAFESMVITEASNAAEVRPQVQVGTTGRDTVYMGSLSKPSAAWGTANLSVSPTEMEAGGLRISIYDLKGLVLIHNNTLQDAEADVAAEVRSAFADVIAEMEDDAFITGDGSQKPTGILSDKGVQDRAVSAGSSLVDSAIEALYGLKKTYRRNATWGFNSNTEKNLRQVKNDNGEYIWQPPVQSGAPATLLGKPIINPEGMPDQAAGAHFMVIGDFRAGYKVRDRQGLTVQRLTERYAEYDQTGIMIKKRVGGAVALPEAFKPVKG